jgi:hypothetical protein
MKDILKESDRFREGIREQLGLKQSLRTRASKGSNEISNILIAMMKCIGKVKTNLFGGS